MAETVVKKKLTVTADTSGLVKGAADVREFGQSTSKTAEHLKMMKAQLEPAAYRAYAAGLKPAIEAEREMGRMARQVANDLKPMAAELRKSQIEALKASEALQKRTLSDARAAEALRRTYDTGYANAAKFLEVEARVAKGIEQKNLTIDQGNAILAGATKRFKQMSDSIIPANQNIKLTGSQVQNLGYQLNDVATMLAMGASPFQIIASQGGQVVQALGDGPQGVRGSLTAIGSSIAGFARSIPAAGYAVAGVTAAVGALYYLTKGPSARTAEESVKSFETAVRRLEDGWKGAGAAAEDHFAKAQRSIANNQSTAMLDTQAEVRKLQDDLKASIRDLNWNDKLPEQILRARSGTLAPAHEEIRELYRQLMAGKIGAADMAAAMLKIRMDPKADTYARSFAEAIRLGIAPAVELEQRIKAIVETTEKLGGKGKRVTSDPNGENPFDLRERFGGVTGPADRFDPASGQTLREQLREQRRGFEEYLDAAEDAKRALANFDLSPVRRQIAETTQDYDRRIEALKGASDSAIAVAALQQEKEAALALITKEATRDEEARRAGYALDLASVTDVTAAQKAATAGQRAYNDAIAAGYDKSYASARSAEASALSLAQAHHQLAEAGQQQALATNRQIEQAKLEYDLVGKSAGEVARLRAEFELLAQAKDAARAAGFDEGQVKLTDEMRRQAAEIGRLTDATQRLNFERDLLFDRQQATRSPEDQRIAEQLRAIGVEFDSAQGRADAAQLRLNERLHATNDAFYEMRDAGKEAFLDLIDAIGAGDDALKSITQTLAGFGRQFASAGLDKIMESLFGAKSSSGTQGGGGLAGVISAVANQNIPIPTPRPNFTSPSYPYSDKYALPTVTAAAKMTDASSSLASVLRDGANRIGASARDLGAVISFETGGKFSTSIRGGANNNHIGLIQFGKAEQAKYGAAIGQTLSQQMDSVVAYLQDRGFKPGMDIYDLYSTINAGRPGRYNASDAANGGTWGSVRDKVDHQFAPHYAKADSILNGSKRDLSKGVADGVSDGLEDYQRKIGTPESYSAGRFDASVPSSGSTVGGKLQNLLNSPFGKGAMNAFGAFGAGVSGGPLSGALTGGLGAIGMGLGPMGIAAGAPAGRCGTLIPTERKAT
ncbi:phage tail length tape measure family protein [Aureimonas sp. ME7]|uniref:phage tail length tape measure family protein n=1 Tax=Aureimonas sp. ME7 TaxID=2744252 RepID=UPI0015FB706F|nr:phage tail length tape measure family protein [Aureimonas sp. ME7]